MDIPAVLVALQRRARSSGAEPLLTHYDLAGGGRTELSVATFANWVNKTANLIEDVGADATAALAAEAEAVQDWLGDVVVRARFPTPLERELLA